MPPIEDYERLTLNVLLEEATRQVQEKKRRVYCDIIISYPNVFDKLHTLLDYYSNRRRSHWKVAISSCAEEDLFLVSFTPKEADLSRAQSPILFFWKISRDAKYVTILSISLRSYREIRRTIDSLVRFVKGLWFAWLGAGFLENFDRFISRVLGDGVQVSASFQTTVAASQKMRVFPLPPREFVKLEDIRKGIKDRYVKEGEIHTFTNMRYGISSEERGMHFTFSMTDRSRITFERGDFTLFVTILRPLLEETRRILGVIRRSSFTSTRQAEVLGESIEIKSFDLIESLVFKKSKESTDWYQKIVRVFGSDVPERKLVNFTLVSGNPYFLVHIIDVENSSSVYLSATSEEMQIVPAESSTKEGTMSKIISLLQAKIDPTITV